MAGVLYQVNGPAIVYIQNNKGGSKLALGICRSQINITINQKDRPIQADNAGPELPADLQYFGADANIRATLSQFDPAVLDALSAFASASPGVLGPIGQPMAANGLTFKLIIPSNYKPWTFYNTVLRRRSDGAGTEFSQIDLEFYAFAAIGSLVNAAGVPLFANVA
jgi:hypothetical protein